MSDPFPGAPWAEVRNIGQEAREQVTISDLCELLRNLMKQLESYRQVDIQSKDPQLAEIVDFLDARLPDIAVRVDEMDAVHQKKSELRRDFIDRFYGLDRHDRMRTAKDFDLDSLLSLLDNSSLMTASGGEVKLSLETLLGERAKDFSDLEAKNQSISNEELRAHNAASSVVNTFNVQLKDASSRTEPAKYNSEVFQCYGDYERARKFAKAVTERIMCICLMTLCVLNVVTKVVKINVGGGGGSGAST